MRTRREYLHLLDLNAKKTSAAFTRSMGDMATASVLVDVVAQTEAQDIDGLMEATNFTQGYLGPLTAAVGASYLSGGRHTTATFPKVKVPPRDVRVKLAFDLENPRAVADLRGQSSTLIREIDYTQREAIRAVLADGLAKGNNPRTTALRIVGWIDPRTKRRGGGILGLTKAQTDWTIGLRDQLEQGDYSGYLKRGLRDRRFDGPVKRALRNGTRIPVKTLEGAARSYTNRMVKLRGDTIGRTETLGALNGGRDEALKQLVDTGAVRRENIKKIWDATADARTRETHLAADGQTVSVDESFTIGGSLMEHPGDWQGPASERINCRCFMRTEIDFIGELEG